MLPLLRLLHALHAEASIGNTYADVRAVNQGLLHVQERREVVVHLRRVLAKHALVSTKHTRAAACQGWVRWTRGSARLTRRLVLPLPPPLWLRQALPMAWQMLEQRGQAAVLQLARHAPVGT